MEPGLGGPAGKRVALAGELTGAGAGQRSFDEIEQDVIVQGREVLRVVLQYVMGRRAAAERRLAQVAGADGVPRRRAERGHRRAMVTWSGPVVIRRMAYRAPGAADLHPADAVPGLPARRYSWQVRRAAVRYVLAGSCEQAQLMLAGATGVSAGKQQLEQIVAEAAADAPGSCPSRPAAPVPAGAALAISADGKGVAIRPEGRPAAGPGVRPAAGHRPEGRVQADRPGRRRLDVLPPDEPRVPGQIMGRGPGQAAPPGPRAASRWHAAEIAAGCAGAIAAVFDEAGRRDPGHERPWIALADGDRHQIEVIRAEAAARGITITVVIDFIHVIEYLRKAAWCFHPPRDPAAGDRVTAAGLDILHGRTPQVIAPTAAAAAADPPRPGSEHAKIIRTSLAYLENKQPYLDYPAALANGRPITAGLIKGARRHLAADRMGITGARGGLEGAQLILRLRAITANGDLTGYQHRHTTQEHPRNHLSRYHDSLTPAA